MRRHRQRPSTEETTKPETSRRDRPKQPPSAEIRSVTQNAEIRQAIEDQSKKPYSDEIRFVKVRMSEQELIKLMECGRIYHAVGKFFMYDS